MIGAMEVKARAGSLPFVFCEEENEPDPVDREPVAFWITVKLKAKYDLLQKQSKRRFAKHLREHIEREIECAVIGTKTG